VVRALARRAASQRRRSINACDRDPIRRIYRSPGSTGRLAGEVAKRPLQVASLPTAIPDPEEESHATK
jgi:hypothetical protein